MPTNHPSPSPASDPPPGRPFGDPPALIPPEGFAAECAAIGVEFEGDDLPRLGKFLAILLEANAAFNLTAIREPAEAWRRHILDAMTLLPVLAAIEPAAEGEPVRVVDVGSGGGVPAIPLAIVMPHLQFTLVESTGKKARFLEAAAGAVGAGNVRVINDRAERLGRWGSREHRECYDAATARAVGSLAVLSELLLPLVRVGGVMLAVKGAKAAEELAEAGKAIALLGGEPTETVETPTGRIVVVQKVKATPRDYPRADGEPASKPIGLGKASRSRQA
ncbi:MAG: 16S rRNA (guanine(527)-N(7))-methyltransferase RsmG [Phycisphaerae bacterium]|nr:16S rRNA (guanine(527)-N(7))-methyltransferase RsmG [Phycisphaerae bacterium]